MGVGEVFGVDVAEPGPPGGACAVHQPAQGAAVSADRELGRQASPTLAARVRRRRERQPWTCGRGRSPCRRHRCDRCLHRGPDPRGGAGHDHDLSGQAGHRRSALASSGSRRRTGGSTGAGAATPTVLVREPRSVDGEGDHVAGLSGGGSWMPRRPHSSARQPPLPTVPDPRTSPGSTSAVAGGVGDHRLEGPPHVRRAGRVRSRRRSRSTVHQRSRKPSASRYGSSSSAVTIHGPRVVAKSLPLAGPRPTCISRPWRSRADQSFMIV